MSVTLPIIGYSAINITCNGQGGGSVVPDTPDTPSTYNITTDLDGYTLDNNVMNINSGDSFISTFTRLPNCATHDMKVTMGGLDITNEVLTIHPAFGPHGIDEVTDINIPSVTGDVHISCTKYYCTGLAKSNLKLGCISSSTATTTSNSSNYCHVNKIIPCVKGLLIRVYMPTIKDTFVKGSTYEYRWWYHFVEVNTTTYTNNFDSVKDVGNLITYNRIYQNQKSLGSANTYTVIEYLVENDNTQGVYFNFALQRSTISSAALSTQAISTSETYEGSLSSDSTYWPQKSTLDTFSLASTSASTIIKITVDENLDEFNGNVELLGKEITMPHGYINGTKFALSTKYDGVWYNVRHYKGRTLTINTNTWTRILFVKNIPVTSAWTLSNATQTLDTDKNYRQLSSNSTTNVIIPSDAYYMYLYTKSDTTLLSVNSLLVNAIN